jgi:hypothetical protein
MKIGENSKIIKCEIPLKKKYILCFTSNNYLIRILTSNIKTTKSLFI